jgi:Na+/H+ antiporter NhaD/arsenite permease-like protein
MHIGKWRKGLIICFVLLGALFIWAYKVEAFPLNKPAPDTNRTLTIVGRVVNTQDISIDNAEVHILVDGRQRDMTIAGEVSQTVRSDVYGLYVIEVQLPLSQIQSNTIAVEINKPGYRTTRQGFPRKNLACNESTCYIRLPDIVLARTFNPAFFIATTIFILVFGLISLNLLHETIAAFLGAGAMLGITYFLGSYNNDYWIISFHRAIHFIDFDVIFLLMTMMIFMAVMSQTGVFQWLAFQTFQLAGGNPFLVTAVLVIITGITSAALNDTTVMLLMAPVSIQIALALDVHPAAIVLPEVMASNIGGAATLIGTPPNTIIGSYVGLGFNQFLIHMLPISVMGMVILIVMMRWLYRDEFLPKEKDPSEKLIAQLESGSQITDPVLLRKSLILFSVTMVLFFIEDFFHMPPAVVAILGSTALLLWVRPNMSEMLQEVDWTTLVFFMSLFMMVGGIQEAGLIQVIAESVQSLAGESAVLAMMLIIWVSAIASAIVANIPFTAAIVPVTVFLTHTIPGAENNVFYWSLALGAGLGGNATYIGSAPNIVAIGVMERAGFRMKFQDFSRIGIPITIATIMVPNLWILIRYFWLQF